MKTTDSFFAPRALGALPDTSAHLMVDIETLSTHVEAPVLSIGAVLFDPLQRNTFAELRARAFYQGIAMENAVKNSSGMDPATVAWWFSQDDSAIKRLVTGDLVPTKVALQALFRYAADRSATSPLLEPYRSLPVAEIVWANSPSFDCVILEQSAKAVGLLWPFKFFLWRDVRTVKDLGFPDGDAPKFNEGQSHDAADDAVAQSLLVQAAYRELGLSPT